MDERTAEVTRVLLVLKAHAAEHAKSTAAEAAERLPDAYEILGVGHDAAAGERGASWQGCGAARAVWVDGRGQPGAKWRQDGGPSRSAPVGEVKRSVSGLPLCPPAPLHLSCPVTPCPLITRLAGEVKKRYWRLSLLIHPDKCDHPRANDAFQAVTGAAKELQVRGGGGGGGGWAECCRPAALQLALPAPLPAAAATGPP